MIGFPDSIWEPVDGYARVLPLTARLERLRYRKRHGIFPPPHIMGELFAPRKQQEQSPLAKRKKELFRGLVKRYGSHEAVAGIDFILRDLGLVEWTGDDYFALILRAYLAAGRGTSGRVGGARSELLDGADLVVLPTDTVYGLMCEADSEEAAARLYALKGRQAIQPMDPGGTLDRTASVPLLLLGALVPIMSLNITPRRRPNRSAR